MTKEQILDVVSEFYRLWNLQAAVLDKLFHEAGADLNPEKVKKCWTRLADQQRFNPVLIVQLRETCGVLNAEGQYDGALQNEPNLHWDLSSLTFFCSSSICTASSVMETWRMTAKKPLHQSRTSCAARGCCQEISSMHLTLIRFREEEMYKEVLRQDLVELRTRLVADQVCSAEFFNTYKDMAADGAEKTYQGKDGSNYREVIATLESKLRTLKRISADPAGAGGYP